MKITVSYISSLYDTKKTIDLINETEADGLHVDLMDGIYVDTKNFDIDSLQDLFKDNTKPMDIHMMVNRPSKYLDKILSLYPDCVYIHPKTEPGALGILNNLAMHEIKRGIVINPDEEVKAFVHYFPYIDRVLLMSVTPGAGGQKFLEKISKKLDELLAYKNENNFEIYIDGGINESTIKKVSKADGVVSGSFICKSKDFEKQIKKLKKSC